MIALTLENFWQEEELLATNALLENITAHRTEAEESVASDVVSWGSDARYVYACVRVRVRACACVRACEYV